MTATQAKLNREKAERIARREIASAYGIEDATDILENLSAPTPTVNGHQVLEMLTAAALAALNETGNARARTRNHRGIPLEGSLTA